MWLEFHGQNHSIFPNPNPKKFSKHFVLCDGDDSQWVNVFYMDYVPKHILSLAYNYICSLK